MKKLNCGLDVHLPSEICNVLKTASEHRYDFVCLPVFHPRFKREFTAKWKDRQGPFTRPDLVLSSRDWNNLIAGKVSPYINVDSEFLCTQSKFTLEQELNYCNHLDVTAVMIPVRSSNTSNLARIVNANFRNFQIWLEMPLISETQEASVWRSDLSTNKNESTWEWWNNFRSLCNYDKRLGIILKVTKSLPCQKELNRWMAEPLKAVVISTSTFLTNKKGYPVLSKPHQIFIKSLFLLDIQVVIRGNNHHYSLDCYQKYMDHLWREAMIQQGSDMNGSLSEEESLGYPLAPLADNLMSHIYELFERDSVKYAEYTKALTCALLERDCDGVINIMVVGAGRGPLVGVALQAAQKTNKKVKIYAVEKNPHAVVTLKSYQEEIWHDSVEIILEDIRVLTFPRQIDILLSELLGSFADNELSPELLDGAQNFLKEGGISIPESYTSYISPVQGSKVYSDLKANREKADWENLFVTVHRNKYNISPSKPLFTFQHPNRSSDPIDNSRYKKLTFAVDQNCVLHGFTGFFETTLYKDVKLSIVPETYTPGLLSWCPVFFPLMEPVYLKTGNTIEAHFWRLIGKKSVWYEWTITKPVPLPVHNPNGRSSSIRLQ